MSTLALNAQAVVSENSDDYLLVMVVDGKRHYFASDFEFAENVMQDMGETISTWKSQTEARERKHHHGHTKEADPPPEKKDEE